MIGLPTPNSFTHTKLGHFFKNHFLRGRQTATVNLTEFLAEVDACVERLDGEVDRAVNVPGNVCFNNGYSFLRNRNE